MRKREFELALEKYRDTIRAIARKLASTDDELVEDLVQEGMIALWKLKPERATKNRDAWIRQALKHRMIDYLRRNDPRMYESLDARLAGGDQLEQDDASGEITLRGHRPQQTKWANETPYEHLQEEQE